jgi:hypothetical protein
MVSASALVGCAATTSAARPTDATRPLTATATTEAPLPAATVAAEEKVTEVDRPVGWADASHGNDVEPDYGVVFARDRIQKIALTIAPADWEAMQANMVELLGPRGSGMGRDRGVPPLRPGAEGTRPGMDGQSVAQPGVLGEGGPRVFGPGAVAPGAGGAPDLVSDNPMWVPATLTFDGHSWTRVGVRYKGNSTLRSSWSSGQINLPLKFDFDEFEDDYPEIDDQRFYGFKQLSLANNTRDAAYVREALAYELLAEAGLPASRTAFYEISLDHGEGSVSLGLYTVIEVVDDTVVARHFGNDDGNIYEADGPAASLREGTRAQIKSSFLKENHEKEADWSDIEALYTALHASSRLSDPAAWRAGLEAVFDVDAFLKWLGLSAVLQHWDSYGAMAHNYYLYGESDSGRLHWISWDHNEVLGSAGVGPVGAEDAGRVARPPIRGNVSLDKADVSDDWPLIRYLLDDAVYYAAYVGHLRALSEGPLTADALTQRCERLAAVVAPYAAAHGERARFESAVDELSVRVRDRAAALATFVASH